MVNERKVVLFVDDDPDLRRLAQLSLERIGGFQVVLVADGEACLDYLQQGHPVDLIVLDVMMPRMGGPETMTAIQARWGASAPPVVFLTANAQSEEIARYRALGGEGVLTKPFDPLTLPHDLRRVVGAKL